MKSKNTTKPAIKTTAAKDIAPKKSPKGGRSKSMQ
jgi:hypothetical protein